MTGSRNGQLFQVEPINSRYSDRNPFAFLAWSNPLAFQSDRSNSFVLLSTAESHLWHERLAHLNHVSMNSLVDGYVPIDICEVCILAKHERKIIHSGRKRFEPQATYMHERLAAHSMSTSMPNSTSRPKPMTIRRSCTTYKGLDISPTGGFQRSKGSTPRWELVPSLA